MCNFLISSVDDIRSISSLYSHSYNLQFFVLFLCLQFFVGGNWKCVSTTFSHFLAVIVTLHIVLCAASISFTFNINRFSQFSVVQDRYEVAKTK